MTDNCHHTLWRSLSRFCLFFVFAITCSATLHAQDEAAVNAEVTEAPTFEELVYQLVQGNLRQMGEAVDALTELDNPRVVDVFDALGSGDLYADRSEPPTIAIRHNNGSTTEFFTGAPLLDETVAELRQVRINNRLRSQLRTLMAQLSINDESVDVRYNAVRRMIRDGVDEDTITLLQDRQRIESAARVNGAIATALALYELRSDQPTRRLEAISILRGSLEREARNTLRQLSENDPDEEVRTAAENALNSIAGKMRFFRFIETVFFGLSLGSVLLLAGIGLAITFGVMGVINMAHGELIMIGAYTTWMVQQLFPDLIQWSLLIAIPAAFVVSGLVGIAIERGVIRFLYGRPLETLLATFGISLILQQAVRTLFTPLNRSVSSPDWISGVLTINPVLSITYTRLYILIFGLLVFAALMLVMKRTSLGLKVRAVSQNRAMARAVGVRSSWVDALTFGLGSGVAGIAGVALSQITNVGPNLGQAYIIDSFMVVVFGGVGNLWGTLVSAMSLGLINNFLEPYAGAMLAKVMVLIMLILFIQKRPKGLFPQKGRAAAD
ncbi:urea ABC transporter permease subunit UrtB [Marinimicrobium sp. ABcell2]|uniref:urea ABC transporter permease subunit UrtB n=1 Tax=Marinimicrobium sp. ABcell2 TaxID=3069751 RepID=UPI0027AFB298|nr:urea ABC transporter permease subunit UrtB [Marinimicrobium sp. ABcell2]MDQ2075863.1 urea ABC transporter permease subunit UrtB [Marinimicrobium sp. ABcell2]